MTYEEIYGWFDANDVQNYSELLEDLPDGSTFAELGTCVGRSLCSVAPIIKRKNLKVVAVDTFEGTASEGDAHISAKTTDWEKTFRENIEAFGITDNIILKRGWTSEVCKNIEDESLELVFIDASHTADDVEADIKNWLPKIKTGGTLSGHDAFWGSVREGYGRIGLEPVVSQNFWFLKNYKVAWNI